MSIKNFKKLISIFIVSILLLSFALPCTFDDIKQVVAATVKSDGIEAKGAIKSKTKNETETTRHRGFAVKGAEYHEYIEEWDKYSVIAGEDGGSDGKGGGASDKLAESIGNSGSQDEQGGIFGGEGGTMPGPIGDGQSSDITEALKRAKEAVEARRAASVASEIAQRNQEYLRESIIESAAAIQKKLQQDLVKSTLNIQETPFAPQKDYGSPVFVPDTNRIVMPEVSITAPTAAPSPQVDVEPTKRQGMVINKEKLSETIDMNTIVTNAPTVQNTLSPVAPNEIVINHPSAETTMAIDAPTAAATLAPPESVEASVTQEYEYYDAPQVETSAVETTAPSKTPYDDIESSIRESESIKESMEQETTIVESEDPSSGGEEPEKKEDKKGESDSEKKEGEAEDKGELHMAKYDEFKGKRVFEIETVGNIGLTSEYLSILSTKTLMLLVSVVCIVLGIVVFLISQRDKRSKRNYF